MSGLKALVLIFGVLACTMSAHARKSTFYVNKVYDYPQTQLEEIIENYDRGAFCAPSAASNILKTFHARKIDQGQLIKLLASPEYMDTNPAVGTTLYDFMQGMARYAGEYLSGVEVMEYQGFGQYGAYGGGEGSPDLDWIADGIGIKKGTWLALHMFKYDAETDEYTNVSGHLVTLVGYNLGARKDILIINDSASFKEDGATNEYISVEPIETGSFVLGRAKIPATGYYKITDGLDVTYGSSDKPYDVVVITGAVRMKVK